MCNGSELSAPKRPGMCSDAMKPERASRSSPSLRASLLPRPLQLKRSAALSRVDNPATGLGGRMLEGTTRLTTWLLE